MHWLITPHPWILFEKMYLSAPIQMWLLFLSCPTPHPPSPPDPQSKVTFLDSPPLGQRRIWQLAVNLKKNEIKSGPRIYFFVREPAIFWYLWLVRNQNFTYYLKKCVRPPASYTFKSLVDLIWYYVTLCSWEDTPKFCEQICNLAKIWQ
jgi:hypothetical protein